MTAAITDLPSPKHGTATDLQQREKLLFAAYGVVLVLSVLSLLLPPTIQGLQDDLPLITVSLSICFCGYVLLTLLGYFYVFRYWTDSSLDRR